MDVMGAAARVGVASSDTESQTYRNFDLAVRMSAELGVREHRRHLKKHKACFTGRAAVQWMIDVGIAEDVPAAVARGAALVDAGLVRGITAERARFRTDPSSTASTSPWTRASKPRDGACPAR